MRTELQIVAFLNDGLARVLVDGKRELWVTGTARKVIRCHLCTREIHKGMRSWRTVSNALHRSLRVCASCWPTRRAGPKH